MGREGHLKLEPLGLWRGGVAGKKRVILAVCVEEEAFAYAFEEGRVLTYDRGWRFEFGEKDILGLSLEACLPFGRRLELGAGWRGGQSPPGVACPRTPAAARVPVPSPRLICMGSRSGQWARSAGHAGSRAGPAGPRRGGGSGGRSDVGPALSGGRSSGRRSG